MPKAVVDRLESIDVDVEHGDAFVFLALGECLRQPLAQAAGAPATLQGLLVAVGLAVVLVLPSLAYLLWLTQTQAWSGAPEERAVSAGPPPAPDARPRRR